MNGDTSATELGLGWYRRQDWDRLIQSFPDRDQMQDSFDAWRADARRTESN